MWSPTDVLENYDGWPQREKAINYPKVPPVFVRNSSIPETGLSPFGGLPLALAGCLGDP